MKDDKIMMAGGRLESMRSMRARALKKLFFVSLLVCGFFTLHPSAFAFSPRATVHVNAESTAHNENLTLGDIAEVRANESQLAVQLRGIALGYAPQVGAVRELTKQRIALAISSAGFSTDTVEMVAPAMTLVRREAQIVDPTLVRKAVERALTASLHSVGAEAKLTRLDLPANIEVATGSVEVRASCATANALFSAFPVSIEFWVEGRLLKRLNTTAQAEAFAPILVAAHGLAAKTRVREGDFKVELRPLVRNPLLYLSEPTRLRGASLVHAVAAGEAITVDALIADIVVKSGDPVRIVGKSGTFSILVVGEARSAGRVGERILVKNLQSGLLFQAVIVDEGAVSVRF